MDDKVLFGRDWFYPFELPDGRTTPTYDGGRLNEVHATRLTMMNQVLSHQYGQDLSGKTAVDLACHQGYFASQLAQRGCDVLGIDARDQHVSDANLIAKALELDHMRAVQSDVHQVTAEEYGQFDIVLMLGLIYHLENPVGAIRVAHALTREVCFVETQVVPNLGGNVDWGNYRFVKPLQGCFGVIDETDETHGPEASTLGICLAPSTEALIWIMHKVGFKRVALLPPPADGYEQHVYGKRVMVAGFID